MSAFNTSTNTGSTTFTNSWGTLSLLPSASPQHAAGFARTDGWRYLEFYVNDAGGDNGRLFMGIHDPISTVLYGGDSNRTVFTSGALALPYDDISAFSLTAGTGDVFMFAIDMSGSGRNHSGTDMFPTTISSGTGIELTPLYIEIGKNGVWPGVGVNTFAYPTGGYPMSAYPFVVRDSTSASDAMVSLRVVTASFAYTIPTGMIAWGDGPAGGGSLTADADIKWDATTKDSEISLTNSNFLATSTAAGSSLSAFSVKTTALVTTGKRVIEFWGADSAHGTSLSSVSPGTDLPWNIGICDADMTSISWSPNATSTKIIWGDDKRRRGVSKATSMTNVQVVGLGPTRNGSIFYLDFDTERLWQRRGMAAANSAPAWWAGRTISGTSKPDPYLGVDGMTFSVSTPGVRMIAWARKDFAGGLWAYVNAGQTPFQTFPLLPGWKSMDGSRQPEGNGTVWDVTVMPSSLSVCYSGLAVRHIRSTADRAFAKSSTSRYSGKKFFEIFSDQGQGGATLSTVVGLIPASVGTFTANTVASVVATGLWWSPGNRERVKNGTTTSASNSFTTTHYGLNSSTNVWWACAVDFDAGKVWFGQWNWNRQAIAWAAGANPATGTQPDMTFTASTTMFIASTVLAGWNYLVLESSNVIGMPSGFDPWDGQSTPVSATATPSGATASGGILWPYGVIT